MLTFSYYSIVIHYDIFFVEFLYFIIEYKLKKYNTYSFKSKNTSNKKIIHIYSINKLKEIERKIVFIQIFMRKK